MKSVLAVPCSVGKASFSARSGKKVLLREKDTKRKSENDRQKERARERVAIKCHTLSNVIPYQAGEREVERGMQERVGG